MKLALDCNALYTSRAGVARYIRGLQSGWAEKNDEVEPIPLAWECENFAYQQPWRMLKTAYRELWWARRTAPRRLAREGYDLLHSTSGWFIEVPRELPHVVTLHDLALIRFPERFRPWLRRMGRQRLERLKDADKIVCVSKFTADEGIELLDLDPAKMEVVHNGYDPVGTAGEDSAPADPLPDPFFLFVGSLEPGKNLALLKEVYQRAAERGEELPALAIAGARWEGVSHEGKPPENWHYLGFVSDAQLDGLYRRALALVFPSKYEGFGLPLVEAMARECPVLASPVASLPEVGGEAVLWSEPTASAYLDALRSLVNDDEMRRNLISAGRRQAERFSWQRCAEETTSVYRSVL